MTKESHSKGSVAYEVASSLSSGPLGFVYRFAAVYGFGKPGKSAAAAAVTLTTQGEMCTTKTKKTFWEKFLIFPQS